MVLTNDLQVKEGTVFGNITSATELFPLLLLLRFALHDLLDEVNTLRHDLIGRHVIEVGRNPFGRLHGFYLERTQDDVLVTDCLAIDPRVAVIEFENVESPSRSHDAACELARFLHLLDQQSLTSPLAIDFSCVVEPDSDVQGHYVYLEVEEGIVIEDLEAASSLAAAVHHECISNL